MPGAVFLRSDRLTLRTIEAEDVDFVHEHKNPPAVHRSYIWPYPENHDDVEEYLLEDDDGTSLLVCREGDDGDPEPVGEVGMHVDDRTREAEIGVWVAEPYWGEGYGTEACERFVDYAFDERNVHRMMAKHIEGNDGSKRIWEKLGFAHEGTHRESEFMDGEYRDMHVYGVLADEWRKRDARQS
ncbi:GNAT family N-acetyltransferase [Halorubellus salinus]|uniref:GNAT family N-acetyltransferase n=1 Tax=Halorubellus salinus TaxID=755309 RepID=UPI001D08C7E3|nr:GNAT family protein [Halorubellus salinus]